MQATVDHFVSLRAQERRVYLPQSSSASRFTAGAAGFLNFSHPASSQTVGSQRGLSRNMSSNFAIAVSQWADEP